MKTATASPSDALELLKDPNQQYLSTIQIKITMIDTLAGGIGGAMLASLSRTFCGRSTGWHPLRHGRADFGRRGNHLLLDCAG